MGGGWDRGKVKEEKIFEEEGLMGCETGKIPGRKKERRVKSRRRSLTKACRDCWEENDRFGKKNKKIGGDQKIGRKRNKTELRDRGEVV